MTQELLLQSITAIYAVCNVGRLLFYAPQMLAVARDPLGANAISLSTWTFWTFSHAMTTVYCSMVVCDSLLAAMMLGNTVGSLAIVLITARQRYGYRKIHGSLIAQR